MSGIFGFSYRSADDETIKDALGGLEYWNRIYGRKAHDTALMERSGIGCHIEHFSDQFPHGGPLLQFRGLTAVVDALLFNRDELLDLLMLPPESVISDEELLLKLIDEKGFDALSRVNGDFAGAIFDSIEHEWILFRDHLGVRPLYFYKSHDLIAFSTDIRGLVAVPELDSSYNKMHVYKSIVGGNSLSLLDTEFEHIHCIHPGSVCRIKMTSRSTTLNQRLYWRIHRKRIRFSTDDAYREELRRLITDAVHRRCDAFPSMLGAELSGGLDSSVIDILINRYGREAVYYSWSSDPSVRPLRDGEDERKVILDICEQEQISCKFLSLQERFNFEYMLQHVMPPYVNTVALSYGSKWMKSQGAQAVFTGHGGDEGVSHRCTRFELLYNLEFAAYFKLYWQDTKGLKLRLLRTLNRCVREAWAKWKRLNDKPGEEDIYPSVFKRAFSEEMLKSYRFRPLPFGYAPYRYIMQGGTRNRLDNGAYQGAFNGVRYLFPYVDHRVMDFAVSIPRRLYLNRTTGRLIFREAFADLMPESLRSVSYKDLASIRDTDQTVGASKSLNRRVDYLLSQLDPKFWAGVLDFDGIHNLRNVEIRNSLDKGNLIFVTTRLDQCVMIQNVQQNAKRWREFDAENKLL